MDDLGKLVAHSVDTDDQYVLQNHLVSITNAAPTLNEIGNRSIQPGQPLIFTVQASGANEDDLEFSAVGSAP